MPRMTLLNFEVLSLPSLWFRLSLAAPALWRSFPTAHDRLPFIASFSPSILAPAIVACCSFLHHQLHLLLPFLSDFFLLVP
ncbi:hypothetical protein C5167_050796 [Papaver somniferum]|uniref:Uncharacterized protein n=1 Tax=Papaver somniferum TaxID=3469 RepID=A0A4Y7KPM6_PAPSO|nr:hypothetical protein C5167_050796 [Papaver somniferum]